ncbi:MAG TPA: Mur ligase family protein [Candidatus Paceibacterota bacterium]
MDQTLINIKRIIPTSLFNILQPAYHRTLAFAAAVRYGFPSRHIKVIAVTGTKGKSTTTEIINAIFEQAGKKTALTNTIRFKIAGASERNLFKMSMPGRFTMQRMLRRAVSAGCEYFICEMTSQGSLLFRHKHIDIDTLIFTNLSPEHIEAHGSYENYVQAKLDLARALATSHKHGKQTTLIVNADDAEAGRFLACDADTKLTYSLKKGFSYITPLQGIFNQYNILGAVTCAKHEGISDADISTAVSTFGHVPGRVEKVTVGPDQKFDVIVDYAHTADSLEKLYTVFKDRGIIAVLGGTGGGRDTAKRAVMGRLADTYARVVILTDEDPYDEDPRKIVGDVAQGVTSKKPIIIMDRREAIREAIKQAKPGEAVLITGKGTDPYIMGPRGTKISWSDSEIAREELIAAGYRKSC